MSRKLAGAPVEQVQAPIGHSPGDPDLLYTFRAPGLPDRVSTLFFFVLGRSPVR